MGPGGRDRARDPAAPPGPPRAGLRRRLGLDAPRRVALPGRGRPGLRPAGAARGGRAGAGGTPHGLRVGRLGPLPRRGTARGGGQSGARPRARPIRLAPGGRSRGPLPAGAGRRGFGAGGRAAARGGGWRHRPPGGGRNVTETGFTVEPIGVVRSPLTRLEAAPLQGDEGAPEARLELTPRVAEGLAGIVPGDELIVLTWLHRARRDVLRVRPRGRLEAPLTGVFATRSQDRPNPVGLHRVSVLEVAGLRLRVAPIEAIDGTPVIDIKPMLPRSDDR